MVTIHFFAGLKRFFPAPMPLEGLEGQTGADAISKLKEISPDASDLLDKCRIAINEEFVKLSTTLQENTELFLIPPSSGG